MYVRMPLGVARTAILCNIVTRYRYNVSFDRRQPQRTHQVPRVRTEACFVDFGDIVAFKTNHGVTLALQDLLYGMLAPLDPFAHRSELRRVLLHEQIDGEPIRLVPRGVDERVPDGDILPDVLQLACEARKPFKLREVILGEDETPRKRIRVDMLGTCDRNERHCPSVLAILANDRLGNDHKQHEDANQCPWPTRPRFARNLLPSLHFREPSLNKNRALHRILALSIWE